MDGAREIAEWLCQKIANAHIETTVRGLNDFDFKVDEAGITLVAELLLNIVDIGLAVGKEG